MMGWRCFGKRGGEGEDLRWESVGVTQRTSIEVIRDALPTSGVFKGSALAGDGERGHEARLVEVAGWILGRVVAHHAGRK